MKRTFFPKLILPYIVIVPSVYVGAFILMYDLDGVFNYRYISSALSPCSLNMFHRDLYIVRPIYNSEGSLYIP